MSEPRQTVALAIASVALLLAVLASLVVHREQLLQHRAYEQCAHACWEVSGRALPCAQACRVAGGGR